MIYYIAAAVPAEIISINASDSKLFNSNLFEPQLFNKMASDIVCSRWSLAFQKAKALQMPNELQSQLYVNARSNFQSSRTCPASVIASPKKTLTIPSSSTSPNNSSNDYVHSGSPLWGRIFR